MKQNVTLRKLTALVLSLVMALSLTTAAFASENVGGDAPVCDGTLGCQEGAHVVGCPLYKENSDTENTGSQTKDPAPACTASGECPLTEGHSEGCPKHPDSVAAIKAVQDMIDALPAEVTADNKGDVEAQLSQIKAKLDAMNEACRGQVIATKYTAAEKALSDLAAQNSEEPSGGEQKDEQPPADPTPTPAPADPTREETAAALVSSLPTEVTKDNAAEVESTLAAIAGYEDILTDEQKAARDDCQAKAAAVRAQMNLDHVNELMGKLPQAGTVTAESLTEEQANAYKAQLTEIDNALLTLTDDQKAAVDRTRYESLANALGSYYEIMNMGDAVAQVGEKTYNTLGEAVKAAQGTSKPVVLLNHCENVAKIKPTKNVTIDLNGFNITFADDAYFLLTSRPMLTLTGEGTVSESVPKNSPVVIKSSAISGKCGVTVGEKVTLKGWAGVFVDVQNGAARNTVVNVKGTLIGQKDAGGSPGAGLYVNGQIKKNGPTITLDNATVMAEDGGCGMLLAGYSKTTITNSKISSTANNGTGIEIRAGELTIIDSEVTGGNDPYDFKSNPSGSTSKNTALAISQHTTAQDLHVTVKSGTFNGNAAIAQKNSESLDDAAIAKVSLDIQAGNFTGEVTSANKTNFITGGTFSTDVSAYVPDGYTDTQNAPNNYVVGKTTQQTDEHVAEVNGQYFKELKNAIAAANGGEVKLLKDTNESITIPADSTITLDLNGKTVTTSGGTVVNNGILTVKDSSEPSTGKLISTGSYCIAAGNDSTTTIASGTIESVEGAVITGVSTGATINITGGTLSASDNAVVAGNGSAREGNPNTINISGGTLNGAIKTGGYVACGVYAPWKDNVNITGGTINVVGGAGVVARAGNVNISGGTINTSGDAVGKVGDSRVVVPCSAVVYDSEASYPAMTAESKIAVTGGTFTSASGVAAVTNVGGDVKIEVSGGSFSSPVDAKYCAQNFHSSSKPDANGKYTVHEHKIELQGKVEATCGKDGYTGDEVCTTCKEVVTQGSVVPATGKHTYSEWVYNVTDCATGGTRVRTCGVCGNKEEETVAGGAAHQYDVNTWSSNEAVHWHDCKICDGKIGIADHDFQWVTVSRAASGTKVQWCPTCGYTSETDWSKLELTLGSNRTTVRPGNTITYTVTVTNKTGMDMDEVVVSGELDKNLTFSKASGDGKYSSKDNVWTVSNLEAGKSATMTLRVTVKSGVKSGTKLEYTAAVTDAEAYNGETFPDTPFGSVTSTVKVASASTFLTNPKTGDPNNVGLWITVMAVSLAAIVAVIVVLIIKSRKKK